MAFAFASPTFRRGAVCCAADGTVPKRYREPTEEELLEIVASLEKQERWARANKKKHWWFTEERSVFRECVAAPFAHSTSPLHRSVATIDAPPLCVPLSCFNACAVTGS